MDDTLRTLLRELEHFGAENDGRVSQRSEKMLNITPDTGELLAIFAFSSKACRVLEIGTSNGYSTLWLADAMKSVSGLVVTVEHSPAKAELARQNFDRAGLSRWIRQEFMDAGELLREQPPAQFDLLFLDSDREHYVAWWPWLQRVIVPGGLLVVDNAISHAAEMEPFIAQVRATEGWRSVIIPIGNGELIALKAGATAE
jgi:predicted O-methyltransferase YrrM